MDVKVHYKMRKRKKRWIVIGISVTSGIIFSTQITTQEVHADEVTISEKQKSDSLAQPVDNARDGTSQEQKQSSEQVPAESTEGSSSNATTPVVQPKLVNSTTNTADNNNLDSSTIHTTVQPQADDQNKTSQITSQDKDNSSQAVEKQNDNKSQVINDSTVKNDANATKTTDQNSVADSTTRPDQNPATETTPVQQEKSAASLDSSNESSKTVGETKQADSAFTSNNETKLVQSTKEKAVTNELLSSLDSIDTKDQRNSITFNGQTSYAGKYDADSQPKEGTSSSNTIAVTFSNINKNDVLKVTVPNFFRLSDGPEVNGFTKSLAGDGSSITYTATQSGINGLFNLNVLVNTLQIFNKTVTGDVTLTLNNKLAQTLSAAITYGLYDQNVTYEATNDTTGQSVPVKVGENFVSKVANNSGNFSSSHLNASTYESIVYTIPVPKGYQLDTAATENFNKIAVQYDNSYYKITQSGIGSNVVITVDPSMFSTSKSGFSILGNSFYFVGKLTTNDVAATTTPTVAFKNKVGDLTEGIGSPFAVTLATSAPNQGAVWWNPSVVYVSANDLNSLNVSPTSNFTVHSNDNQVSKAVTITITVPQNTLLKGLNLSDYENSLQQMLANGMTGQLRVLDGDGKILATQDLKQIAGSSVKQVTWLADAADTNKIKTLEVDLNNLPGRTFGSLGFLPIFVTTALPNGKKNVLIPVKILDKVTNITFDMPSYSYEITDSHDIYSYLYMGAINYPVSANSIIGSTGTWDTTYNLWVASDNGKYTYQTLDQDAYVYFQLPSHTSFVKNSLNNYVETIRDQTSGLSYLKLRIPKGSTFSSISGLLNTLKVDSDLTPGMKVKLDDTQPDFLVALQGQKIDEDTWVKSGRKNKIYNSKDLVDQGLSVIANDLNTMGITQIYGGSPISSEWPVSIPKLYFVSDGIKNNNTSAYTSGDTPADFSTTLGNEGTIRLYSYNGTSVVQNNFKKLLTLPTKGNGQDFSINLTGPVTSITAGTEVLYSTQPINLSDGAKLTNGDLSKFVTADQISDWSTVRSVLFQAATIPSNQANETIVPVVIQNVDSVAGNKLASANSVSYTDEVTASTKTTLEARVAVPAKVTVNYLDKTGKAIQTSDLKTGVLGDFVTVMAPVINGYQLVSGSPVNYQYTDKDGQHIDFTYDLATMTATVNLVDAITGTNLGSKSINGKYMSTVSLTDNYYTQVQGYTTAAANVKDYTFTNASLQTVNLYFNPIAQKLTIYYKNKHGVDLAISTSQTGYNGNGVQMEAVPVVGYKPEINRVNYTFSTSSNQSYTFVYDGEVKNFTIAYQLTDGKDAPKALTFQANVGDTFDETSAKVAIPGYNFSKIVQGALKATVGVDGNDQVILTDSDGKQLSGTAALNTILQYKPLANVAINSAGKVYDGKSIDKIPTLTLASGMVAPAFSLDDFLANGKGLSTVKDAAAYQIGLSDSGKQKLIDADGNIYDLTNFDWSKVTGTYTITPATATIEGPHVHKTYDGQAYKEELTPTLTGVVAGDKVDYSFSDISQDKDAGTYAIKVTVGDNKNYTIPVKDGTLVIDKAKAELTVPNNLTKVYDGNGYTTPITPSITGVVAGDSLNYTVQDLSQDKNVGRYEVNASLGENKNYEVSVHKGQLSITPATVTIEGPHVHKTYDGQAYKEELTPVLTGVVNGEKINYGFSDISQYKDAGTYAIKVTAGDNKNYAVTVKDGVLVIDKAKADLTVPNNLTKTYDGNGYTTPITPSITGLVAGDTLNYTVEDLSRDKDAGTYDVNATLGENKNYDVTVHKGQLVITPATATIEGPNVRKTYDGQAYKEELTPALTGVLNGDKINYSFSDISQDKDAGTYAIKVTAGDNKNYTVTVKDGSLVIDKAKADLIVPNDLTKVYDGNGYTTPVTPSITGVIAGDSLNYTVQDLSQDKNVGTYEVNASIGENKNYDVTVHKGQLVITPATVTIEGPHIHKTYDGQAYKEKLTPTLTGIIAGDQVNYSFSDISQDKDAGTYAIKVTAGDNKNYTVAVKDGSLVIDKAKADLTVPSNLTKVYDGKGYTTSITPSITGVVAGDTLNYTVEDLSQDKNVGTYEVNASIGENKNYNVIVHKGQLVITPATVTIEGPHIHKTYDGQAYNEELTPALTGVVNGEKINYSFSDISQNKDAGTYAIKVTAGDNKNYTVTVKDGTLVIDKAKADLTVPSDLTKVYDGKGYTNPVTPSITGVIAGDSLNYNVEDLTQDKDAGTYEVNATLGENKNYDVTVHKGQLIITPATATIDGPNVRKTYDGQSYNKELNPVLTGFVKGDQVNYSFSDISQDKDAGTYAIKVTAGENKNYKVTVKDGSLVIDKAKASVKFDTFEHVEDGKKVPVKYTVDNPVLNQLLEKMGIKSVGPKTGTYIINGKEFSLTELSKNFDISVVPGVIKIISAKHPATATNSHKTSILTPNDQPHQLQGTNVESNTQNNTNDVSAKEMTISKVGSEQVAKTSEKVYPQTGEKENHFGLLGALIVGIAGLFGLARNKKED
ncbi:MBG domain-containing protein [Enterococcus malodoratus]|uniref:MBG domain-containing protein n=1 Tax=Enterococcus malodoratus TaxID=71451 RepID=UPI0020735C6B|nr:MBG domain-containing protein [Enterococcus malodoratus]